MRCPKCQYISFDSNDRCRNCGYEFALTAEAPSLDLPIHTGNEAFGPLDDLPMSDLDALDPAPARSRLSPARPSAEPERRPADASRQARPITSVFDLPLFKDRSVDDDRPLVAPPAVPRPPLAVRRSSPVISRGSRLVAQEPALDLDSLEPPAKPLRHAVRATDAKPGARPRIVITAGILQRLFAALLDAVILSLLGAMVLYITLQVCGLQFSDVRMLPVAPMAGFLLLLGGGYFVLLTAAGGQTIGKMAAGIKVIPAMCERDTGDRVSLGHSVMRTVGYLVSLLPVGLGFLPALFGADRRALHDRLADTRVVKA